MRSTYASIGALLLVVGIAIDPLSQQLISYKVTPTSSSGPNATVGIVTEWREASFQNGMIIHPSAQCKSHVVLGKYRSLIALNSTSL